ncbi:hypothetical protein ARC20_02600 [Stenotrophomonas panacihumi]|uniref:Haemolysin-type calcium binding-related domain-containing protein n=1 Tax=Stenotrophomonas panacihumi TaxID=676599 RepID=A0A0R0B4I0_9GAMM|nr:calcium-binding protein [Stenotrophomonas panacihumi]KRG47827.1 hypothetical protein ARC20_02600 [Stenotrophomonas panacihumi]PTN55780.1 calcium-binding protein [Stenotrophomonas panacihumi]
MFNFLSQFQAQLRQFNARLAQRTRSLTANIPQGESGVWFNGQKVSSLPALPALPTLPTLPIVPTLPADAAIAPPLPAVATPPVPSVPLPPPFDIPASTAQPPAITPKTAGRNFVGGLGRDVLTTGAGDDVLNGGMGNDTLDAGAGNNIVQGGMGNDMLTVGQGDNNVDGGMGDDIVRAGDGRNRLYGGMGNDSISAGNGGNLVDAGMGDDRVVTGSGNDTLTGGMGNDRLSAGGGSDTYRFDNAFGADVIDNRDASASTDRVEFSTASGIQAQQLWFRRDGADLVVDAVASEDKSVFGWSSGISGVNFGSGNVFGNIFNGSVAGKAAPQREGSITLRNWYSDPASQVDLFQDASGRTLQKGQVDGLVSAMAGFGGVPASLSSLSDAQRQQLDVVIARNWAA